MSKKKKSNKNWVKKKNKITKEGEDKPESFRKKVYKQNEETRTLFQTFGENGFEWWIQFLLGVFLALFLGLV